MSTQDVTLAQTRRDELKPDCLYHGSSMPLQGEALVPRQAYCSSGRPENTLTAVYATDKREIAIQMALLGCKGTGGSTLTWDKEPAEAIVYIGWPEQEFIYVHKLPSDTFDQAGPSRRQWASLVGVKPLETEKIMVKDVIHLVREPTENELVCYFEKHPGRYKIKS